MDGVAFYSVSLSFTAFLAQPVWWSRSAGLRTPALLVPNHL